MKVFACILALALAFTSVLPGYASGRSACAMVGCDSRMTGNEHEDCPSAATQIATAAACCRPGPAPWASQTKLLVLPDTAAPATAVVPVAVAHNFDATAPRVASAGPAFSYAPLAQSCILRI